MKKVIEETESLAGGRYSNAKDDVRVDATASTVSTGSIAALQLEVWYSSTWRLDVAMNHEFSTRVRVGRRLNRLATERGGIQKIEFRTHYPLHLQLKSKFTKALHTLNSLSVVIGGQGVETTKNTLDPIHALL